MRVIVVSYYEGWTLFIKRKLIMILKMVGWIEGKEGAGMNFSVILIEARIVWIYQVPKTGTGVLLNQEVEDWHTAEGR